MSTYGYKIGLTYAGQVNVEDLLVSTHELVPPPRGMSLESSSTVYTALDGHSYGDGYPICQWEFDFLSSAAFNVFLSLLGSEESVSVYITTRLQTHTTYQCYTAILHKPRIGDSCNWAPGGWTDVLLKFSHLISYP